MIENFLEVIKLDPFELTFQHKNNKLYIENISLDNNSNIKTFYLNLEDIRTKSFNDQKQAIDFIKTILLNTTNDIVYNVDWDPLISGILNNLEKVFKEWKIFNSDPKKFFFSIKFKPTSDSSIELSELVYSIFYIDQKELSEKGTIDLTIKDLVLQNTVLVSKKLVHIKNVN